MRKFKKGFAVLTTAALAASMLIPATVMNQTAKAESPEKTCVKMDYDKESMTVYGKSGTKKVYVSVVKNGKEGTAEIYDANGEYEANVDLSTYVAKGTELKIYTDTDKTNKVSVKIPAQEKKVKAALKDDCIEFSIGGTAVTNDKVEYRTATTGYKRAGKYKSDTKKVDSYKVDKYYKKGATLFVRRAASNPAIKVTAVAEADGYFASKDAKLKIKAEAKAPTIKVDAVKGTISFPKGTQYKFTQGWLNDVSHQSVITFDDMKEYTKALDAKKDMTIDEFMSTATKGGIVTSGSSAFISSLHNPSEAAIIEVRTAATATKIPSKVAEVKIPWQKVITSTAAITKGNFEITFDYADKKKTRDAEKVEQYEATGLTIKNASSASLQYAIVDSADATTIQVKDWKTLKNNISKKFKMAKLPEGKYIAVRTLGINDDKKTADNEMELASNVVFSDKIDYPDKVGSDLSVSWGKKSGGESASAAAITVGTAGDGFKYYYQVADKGIAGYSIGKAQPSGVTEITTNGTPQNVKVTTEQYVIVYQVKDGVVVKYSSAKASNVE